MAMICDYETRTIETEDGERMVFRSVEEMYKYLKANIREMAREKNIRRGWGNWPFVFRGITK